MPRISKNIIFNAVGQIILLLAALFSVKYIHSYLGAEALGLIYFVNIINSLILAAFNKGIAHNSIREVSKNIGDHDYIQKFVQTWSSICWGLFLVTAVLILFSSQWVVTNWIRLETISINLAIRAFCVLGVSALFAFQKSLYNSLLVGLQRMDLTNIINVSGGLALRGGQILILVSGGELLSVIWWIAFVYFLEIVLLFVICGTIFSFRSLLPIFSLSIIRRNARFTSQMTLVSILLIIQKQIDKLSLSKLLPISMIGFYSFAYNNIAKGIFLSQAIAQAAYPDLCERFNRVSKHDLFKYYSKLQDLVCFLHVPVLSAIIYFSDPLFSYVFDASVAGILKYPVLMLCIGFYMNCTFSIPNRVLLASGFAEIAVKQNLLSIFVIVPITILLVSEFGILGASISWMCYFLLIYMYSIPKIFTKCLQQPVRLFFRHQFKIIILAAITYVLAKFIIRYETSGSFVAHVSGFVVASALYMVGAFLLIGKELKVTLTNFVKSVMT